MRSFKKFTAIVIALAMVLSLCSMVAFAEDETLVDLTVTADKTVIAPGESIDVNISFAPKAAGVPFVQGQATFEFLYDKSAFNAKIKEIDPAWEALSDTTDDFTSSDRFGIQGGQFGVGTMMSLTGGPVQIAVVTLTAKDTANGDYSITAGTFTGITMATERFAADIKGSTVTVTKDAPPTEAPATAAPATQAPATAAPATQAPATAAPATQAPATAAPATEAPATAAPTQPPVADTEFTITISGKDIPENVKSLVVKSDIDSDDSIVIERDANGDFTKTLPKGKTYSVVEIRDEKGDALPLDVVKSDLTFSETENNVVIVEKEGEDAFTVAVKEAANVSGTADESADSILAKVENLTVTVTTPVQDGEPTVEDVVYSDATKGDFTLRLVDDHNIMVIYKGVAADKFIKVERTISEFGATIGNPAPNQVMPTAEISLPGHYTVDTDWYMITENGETLVSDTYEADYRTEYKAVITFKPEHELDSASENAKYYLNGAETAASENKVEYRYTTGGKASIGNSTFGTGGGSGTTATAAPSTEPVVTPPTAEGKQVFDDVPPTYWAYDYIMDLYNAGIVNGETANMYMPENNITRAEFTKIAVNVFGLEAASTTSQFSDVKASDWFAPYVIAATEAGLVNGISANEFAPNADITREQMATIIGRQMNMTSTAAMTYPDAASISDYAKEYVAGLSENGLLQGDETGNFRPQANAARSEASALLDRVYVLTKGEDVPEEAPETTEAPTAAPSNDNSGFSTGTSATAAPTATDAPEATSSPDASEAPEASATPEA